MKRMVLVLLLFSALTAVLTFPLVFNMNKCIPGTSETTESFATLWGGWKLKYAFINRLDLDGYQFNAYPFGQPVINDIAFPAGIFIIKWLSILTNEILMYNILTLLSFLLSAFFVFILVYYLSGNSLAAFFSGIIYAFCPYHFARAWQHFGLAQIQWLPLYVFSLIKLFEERSIRNILLVALSFILVNLDYTYTYLAAIATSTYLAVFLLSGRIKQKKELLKLFFLLLVLIFVLSLPSMYIIYKNYFFGPPKEAMGLYHRPFGDLFTQSARPLSYFLPSAFHPVFGSLAQMFIGFGLYGKSYTEHSLYLGWIPIILAAMVFKRSLSRKEWFSSENFHINFLIFLAIIAWLFSQPPWWRLITLKIYMPSFFMYKILPMFRAYSRFGILVMLSVSVLAGFGLKFILDRFKSRQAKIAVTALFCGLVLFEFWNYPPFRIIDLTRYSQVYDWLRGEPGDTVIAEYPLDLDGVNEMYKFYQTKHHKRMINGTLAETYANRVSRSLNNISELRAAEGLRWLGVKYALVHKDYYTNSEKMDDLEIFKNVEKNPGLKLVKKFAEVDVYEVIAKSLKPVVQ
jgi:hypothetical protein